MPDSTAKKVPNNEKTNTYDLKAYYQEGGNFQMCCCACFAPGTPIAISDGMKRIEEFKIGDSVSTGSLGGDGTLQLSWDSKKIEFSSGTYAGSKSIMIHTTYGEDKEIITTPDHLFLLATGKFQRADRLVPQKDQLMSADGKAIEINTISIGEWNKGLHNIASSMNYNGSANGHLLNANGIVTGDYCLQVHQDDLMEKGMLADPAKSPP